MRVCSNGLGYIDCRESDCLCEAASPLPADVERVVADWTAAMEGVTPGPWEVAVIENDGAYGGGPDAEHGYQSYAVCAEINGKSRSICDTLNADEGEVHVEYDEDDKHAWDEVARRNMEHIARCSPDGIRALLSLIEAQQRALISIANVSAAASASDDHTRLHSALDALDKAREIARALTSKEPTHD